MQTAQAVHAAFLFSTEFPEATAVWHRESNYVVALQAQDLEHLVQWFNRCTPDINRCMMIEPDLEDEPTAFAALGPAAGRLLSSLPLAGKEVAYA